MTDNTELKRLAQRVVDIEALDGAEPIGSAWDEFEAAATPAAVLALIAESEALKGPHDWLAEDLIKELVDNAQSFQESSCEEGEDPFVIVLLAAASRIRRQEANLDQLKTENKRLVPFEEAYGTACNVRNRLIRENELLDQLIVHNKALSDSFRAERDQLKAENELLASSRAKLAGELSRLRAKHKDWSVDAALGKGEQS